jgi:hypothetical protein
MSNWKGEREWREAAAADKAKVQLVSAIKRACRRSDRVGALDEFFANLHAYRDVLTRSEWRWFGIRLNPDAGKGFGVVDPCCEDGVIGRIVTQDAERCGRRVLLI